MAKYFIHEGMEFKTIEVLPATVGSAASTNLQAVDLISVAKALGTSIISGADDDALKVTLVAIWETVKSNALQELNRDILRQTAALNGNATPGTAGDASEAATINYLSAQYILPPEFTNVLYALPDTTSSVSDRMNYALVKSLEIRHDNIIKHDSSTSAWEAWRRYSLAKASQADRNAAIGGYLVNPGTTTD